MQTCGLVPRDLLHHIGGDQNRAGISQIPRDLHNAARNVCLWNLYQEELYQIVGISSATAVTEISRVEVDDVRWLVFMQNNFDGQIFGQIVQTCTAYSSLIYDVGLHHKNV